MAEEGTAVAEVLTAEVAADSAEAVVGFEAAEPQLRPEVVGSSVRVAVGIVVAAWRRGRDLLHPVHNLRDLADRDRTGLRKTERGRWVLPAGRHLEWA